MVDLSYYDLIDPTPYNYKDICHIRSVKLSDISALEDKYATYKTYINLLGLDVEDYYSLMELTDDDVVEISKRFEAVGRRPNIYDLVVQTPSLLNELIVALNFFIVEDIAYSKDKYSFCTYIIGEDDEVKPVSYFGYDNYDEIVDIINQRHSISRPSSEDKIENQIFKNARARQLWLKMNDPKVKALKKKQSEKKYDLANVISSLSAKSKTISILNVWDLTVYNVYDQFERERTNAVDSMNARSVSIWGDGDKKYNYEQWYENIKEGNN